MAQKIVIPIFISFFILSCQKKKGIKTSKLDRIIDTEIELRKWKEELISKKELGYPCRYKDFTSLELEKWSKDNPNQENGIPDDKYINIVNADLDGDGKRDLLMHFVSENCIGHNGGTPTYAKVIYANNSFKTNLMKEIKTSIIIQFNKKKSHNKNLKDITENYLEETLTISYNNGLKGEFELYAKNDAHCCPSYRGKYTYNIKNKNMDLYIK